MIIFVMITKLKILITYGKVSDTLGISETINSTKKINEYS